MLWVSEFSAVVLCFLYSLLGLKEKRYTVPIGLAFTVAADFCLVVCHPQRRLLGMLFFLCTQCAYAYLLHRENTGKTALWVRLCLTLSGVALAFLVLGKQADALAIVSLCYYTGLITNIGMAFCSFKKRRLFAVGLVLFLLCDTVVGLQAACGGYLPIKEGTALYNIIFPPFNLAWFFYLPSQVLIALSGVLKNKNGQFIDQFVFC